MSRATRLANADRCFVPRDPTTGRFVKTLARVEPAGWQLGRNRAGIAGGLGYPLIAPVDAGGITWTVDDGDPWGSPIGAALAVEMAGAR